MTRDLSDYIGLGFWVLRLDDNSASLIEVHFPIPDTVRFHGACSSDDDDPNTECFNDFVSTIRLGPTELGVWTYKEVLFQDLAQNPYWGLQLDLDSFPPSESLGLKFQFGLAEPFDFYLDDIFLLR